jgi:hypothetical protein
MATASLAHANMFDGKMLDPSICFLYCCALPLISTSAFLVQPPSYPRLNPRTFPRQC